MWWRWMETLNPSCPIPMVVFHLGLALPCHHQTLRPTHADVESMIFFSGMSIRWMFFLDKFLFRVHV